MHRKQTILITVIKKMTNFIKYRDMNISVIRKKQLDGQKIKSKILLFTQ